MKVLPSVKKLVHFIFVNDILVYEKIKLKMHGVPKNEMPTVLDFFSSPKWREKQLLGKVPSNYINVFETSLLILGSVQGWRQY